MLRTLERFAGYGDRQAIVGVGWDRSLTYAQTRELVLDLAAALRDEGYRPGMTVAIMVAHPPEAFPLQLALHLLGCRTVWIAHVATRAEVFDVLDRVPPDRLIYDTRTHGQPGRVVAEHFGVPVHCLRPDGLGPDLLAPRPAGAEPFDLDTATGAPWVAFQTSGTTGRPKLIVHGAGLYEQMFTIADDWVAAGEPLLRHLSLTAMWHASGQAQAMLNLVSGGVLFVLWNFGSAAQFLGNIERYRANSCFISPLMFYQLLDEPAADTTDLSGMTLLSVGGAPVSTARLRECVERFGPIVRIAYGLSELPYISTFPGITEDAAHPDRLRSCGPPHGDVRVEIRDEDGTVLPPGQVGELWASSRLVFQGYHGEPQRTAETLVDGWVRTRDLAHLDDEGYLHIVGRAEDKIITGLGSFHIYPRPIEDALTSHPAVRAAAVIGVPHETLGEAAHAFVVLDPGATVTPDELSAVVTKALHDLWAPRSYDFVDDLPLAGIGKVDLRQLRARWAAEHRTASVPAG
ncbi:MAG TPA: AMP-binding protein [Pseudonocardiaceae bacterium]